MSYSHKKLTLTAITIVLAASVSASASASASAFADNETTETSTSPTMTATTPAVKTSKVAFDYTQLIVPMEAREDAIANALAKEFEALGSALSDRRFELKAAYTLNDRKAVRGAIKVAHKKYHDAVKAAHTNSITERKAAWDIFNKAVKALRNPASAYAEGRIEKNDDTK